MALSMSSPFTWGAGGAQMTPEMVAKRRQVEDALIARGVDTSPVGHWSQGLARVTDALAGSVRRGRLDKAEAAGEKQGEEAYQKALEGFGAAPKRTAAAPISTPSPAPSPSPAGDAASMGAGSDYATSVRASESGGNDQARNPKSSATGPFQFLDGTWDDIRTRHPDLGLTPDGRTDAVQAKKAMNVFTTENATHLGNAGIKADRGNLYAAHFLGAGGAVSALKAPDNTPMASLVSPEVLQANPQLQTMTAGAFKQWAAQKGGGAAPAGATASAAPMAPAAPQAAPAGPGGLSPDLLAAAGNEWMKPGQRAVIGALLDRQIKANAPKDLMEVGGRVFDPNSRTTVADFSKPEAPTIIPKGATAVDRDGKVVFGGSGGQAPADFDDTAKLRGELHQLPSYKNLAQAMPIYSSMVETAGRDTRASDLNLVYGLGKIFDPTSVVREGEMVMVKDTSNLPDWLAGEIARVNGGAALSPTTRQAILTEGYGRMNGYKSAFDQDAGMYRGIAERNKINTKDVIPEFGEIKAWEPAPAAAAPVAPVPITATPGAQPAAAGPVAVTPGGATPAAPSLPLPQASPAPAGVPPELWDVMTPEERSAWSK